MYPDKKRSEFWSRPRTMTEPRMLNQASTKEASPYAFGVNKAVNKKLIPKERQKAISEKPSGAIR